MGDPTPASAADECPSTSTRGSGADRDNREPENTIITSSDSESSSSSESSDDESGDEQSDTTTTTEPLVALHTNGNGETGASGAQDTLHPAVSSGDLHLIQALKQEWYLTDREKFF